MSPGRTSLRERPVWGWRCIQRGERDEAWDVCGNFSQNIPRLGYNVFRKKIVR